MPEYLEKRRAVIRPRRTDDLHEGVAEWIGKEVRVQFHGLVEDGAAYEGQEMWALLPGQGPEGIGWVPGCDLVFSDAAST